MDTNKSSFYDRSSTDWDEEEDEQLRGEYDDDEYDIIQIGIIHRRTPGGIAFRLKKLERHELHTEARGYEEYVKSALYKDVVANPGIHKSNKRTKIERKVQKEIVSLDVMDIYMELAVIKKDIKELMAMMKAVYEFEDI
jgi:hypothetical protein